MEEYNKSIKLLVADDHTLFRQGLVSLLARDEAFKEIAEASDGQELLAMVPEFKPDVVLLDLKMPKLSGIQVMPILREEHPKVKVLVISMHANPAYISALIKDGASGYLLKDATIDEVTTAIKIVLSGKNYINELVAEALIQTSRKPGTDEDKPELEVELNAREKLLVKLIVQEFTSAEIAKKIFQSKRTVDAQRRKLFAKIGVKTVAGLTAFAIKHKIE